MVDLSIVFCGEIIPTGPVIFTGPVGNLTKAMEKINIWKNTVLIR
jgi:hypothetical protein